MGDEVVGAAETPPERGPVEVRRSARRRRTVSAYREGERVVVLMPDSFTAAEEESWVREMVTRVERSEGRGRLTDEALLQRALTLNDAHLGGLARPDSVRWVANQQARWGSCSPGDRSIRLSDRLQPMPVWVIDYVIVHELAHLLDPTHDAGFWAWVERYPRTERARGFLLGWSEAARVAPPDSEQETSGGPGLDVGVGPEAVLDPDE